jgi:hypothetical protein
MLNRPLVGPDRVGGERDAEAARIRTWEQQVLSARGVQAGRNSLRIRHISGMEVRKKRPRGFK